MRNFSLIRILKNLIGHLKAQVAYFINLAKIQKSNPTGRFHLGVRASNSTFGQYNVIFKGVTIVNSKIGSHTYIQEKSVIVNAQIGKFCSIASNVSVGPGIHKTDGVSTHPAFYLIDTPLVKTFSLNDDFESSKQTNIGNDVWIGEKVIIIDGVNIGTGAIIAAGAVVTKDVEPYSIAGGVPARHIKYRFSEDLIQGLLRSEWWNKDDLWLKEHAEDFSDVNKFMKL